MRVLLDENLNWRLQRFLPGHNVRSVPLLGWAGLKNGRLLEQAAADGFEVLLTMDGSLASQQNLATVRLAVIALTAVLNRLEDTSPLMPKVLLLLPTLKPGQLVEVRD